MFYKLQVAIILTSFLGLNLAQAKYVENMATNSKLVTPNHLISMDEHKAERRQRLARLENRYLQQNIEKLNSVSSFSEALDSAKEFISPEEFQKIKRQTTSFAGQKFPKLALNGDNINLSYSGRNFDLRVENISNKKKALVVNGKKYLLSNDQPLFEQMKKINRDIFSPDQKASITDLLLPRAHAGVLFVLFAAVLIVVVYNVVDAENKKAEAAEADQQNQDGAGNDTTLPPDDQEPLPEPEPEPLPEPEPAPEEDIEETPGADNTELPQEEDMVGALLQSCDALAQNMEADGAPISDENADAAENFLAWLDKRVQTSLAKIADQECGGPESPAGDLPEAEGAGEALPDSDAELGEPVEDEIPNPAEDSSAPSENPADADNSSDGEELSEPGDEELPENPDVVEGSEGPQAGETCEIRVQLFSVCYENLGVFAVQNRVLPKDESLKARVEENLSAFGLDEEAPQEEESSNEDIEEEPSADSDSAEQPDEGANPENTLEEESQDPAQGSEDEGSENEEGDPNEPGEGSEPTPDAA